MLLEGVGPPVHRAWILAEEFRNLRGTQSAGHEQQAVQAVFVPGCPRSPGLLP